MNLQVEYNIPFANKVNTEKAKKIIEALAGEPVGASIVVGDAGGLESLSYYASRAKIKVKRKTVDGVTRVWRVG